MANASNSILYHYGLELNYTGKGDHVIDTEYWYKNSLPMHSKTSPIREFSISANSSQRCMYGTGQRPKSHEDEHRYLHALNEAMIIDMSFAGNNEQIQQRENYTSLLLFSLYDFAHSIKHQDYTLPSVSEEIPIEEFSNFSLNVETCIDSGRQWIELNQDADTDVKTYRLYHGWCSALSQQFVINYVYLTKKSKTKKVRSTPFSNWILFLLS